MERPPWASALGQARLVGCWQMTDVFGDQANVLCAFDRGSRSADTSQHGLMFLLDFNGPGPWAKDLFVVDEVDEALAQMRSAATESESITRLVQVGAADVRALLVPPLMASVEAGPADFFDVPSEEVDLFWALALARLRDLPETTQESAALPAEQVESLLTEFLHSPEAADTDLDGSSLRRWADLIARYGNECDAGRPLRVGPGKTLTFVLESEVEDADTAPLAEVVLAWNAWAARRAGLPEEAVEELVYATGMILDQVFGDPDDLDEDEGDPWPTRVPQGSGRSTPVDVAERRRFAMPHREAVIDGERYTGLDPEDADDLELLVIGEHPELHHVLADPTSAELVDGVNPRLHIALLTVVVTRLWTGEPASAWRTAKRMLAAGMERQEIFKALAVPVAEEIHAALTPELGLVGARGGTRHTGKKRRSGRGGAQGEGSALQVRVDLAGARPPIWRRLVLPATASLAELHLVLQLAFGWTDSHLHGFRLRGRGHRGPHDVDDEVATQVGQLLTEAGERLAYEYDFGDSWVHQIVLEDLVVDEGAVRCLGGRRAGPPEDCGGIYAYNDLVEAWGSAGHEGADLLSDPARFDRVMIDDRLRRLPVS